MPIKPEKISLYPKNWAYIRFEILERADHRCEAEGCLVPNHLEIQRYIDDPFEWMAALDDRHPAEYSKPVKVVLTIAHLDHNPRNNGRKGNRPNLKALCQRCHLLHDQAEHMKNAKSTREKKELEAFERAGQESII